MDLKGKIAIVTGGGSGIGEGIVRRFVSDGSYVCIADNRPEKLEAVANSLPSEMIKICSGDVSIFEDVKKIVDTALSFGKGLHVLVNNAGIGQDPADIIDIDLETWKRVFDVNVNGPFLLMKSALPHIIKSGGGSVINISSLAGLRCIPNMPAYCASKGGLISLTQQAALDYGRKNVRCNVICPGSVRTEMIEGAMENFARELKTDLEGFLNYFSKDVPLRRIASPDEIAALCSFLASDDSSFLTGTVIPADGGAAIVDVQGTAISNISAD
ncbi:MAG: SDR family oxidoreductase [Spirochaetes bacterium]|nr:SDR family oxidoreductase [Spirochaetota bacterium]